MEYLTLRELMSALPRYVQVHLAQSWLSGWLAPILPQYFSDVRNLRIGDDLLKVHRESYLEFTDVRLHRQTASWDIDFGPTLGRPGLPRVQLHGHRFMATADQVSDHEFNGLRVWALHDVRSLLEQ
jgi:hypothetical protein